MAKLQDAQAPYLTLTEQASAPATPGGGDQRLYVKDDGSLYRVNDVGTEIEVGAGGGGGGGGRDLLEEVVLTVAASTLSFTTSIPTSGYRDLEIEVIGRTAGAVLSDTLAVSLNGDSADANYVRQVDQASGSSASAAVASGVSGSRHVGVIAGATATAGWPGIHRLHLPGFRDTDWVHVMEGRSFAPGAPTLQHNGVLWKNTVAITSITLTPISSAQFVVGTRARLYGIV